LQYIDSQARATFSEYDMELESEDGFRVGDPYKGPAPCRPFLVYSVEIKPVHHPVQVVPGIGKLDFIAQVVRKDPCQVSHRG
jgi:hypothetical protein